MLTLARRSALLWALWAATFLSPTALALQGNQAGLRTMEHPELLPCFLPAGTETKQFISYDTSGGNADGDFYNSFVKYIDTNRENVIFDEWGPGCLYRQQMNVWWWTWPRKIEPITAGRIKYYFDNEPTPRVDMDFDTFFSGTAVPFDAPFGFKDPGLRFAILYYPFPFKSRLKVTTTLNLDSTTTWYQYTYLKYPTPEEVQTWAGTNEDSASVRRQWNNLGTDPKSAAGNVSVSNTVSIPKGATTTIARLTGQGSIASLKLHLEPYSADVFYNVNIRIYWDGSSIPAVDLPLGYLFGGGGKEYSSCNTAVPRKSLTTLLFGFNGTNGDFYTYFPMPYWSSAKFDVQNNSGAELTALRCEVQYKPAEACRYARGQAGYFCAKRTVDSDPGNGLYSQVFSEQGRGHTVCMSFYSDGYLMDGDEFTYIDDSRTPQIHGDGTEDDHDQGWGGDAYQKPLWGGLVNGYQGAYRICMNDCYIFDKNIRINYEYSLCGGVATRNKTDVTVFYYKAGDGARLGLTDELDVGNAGSERAHSYTITGQTWVDIFTSAYDGYEKGVNYDMCTDDGRAYRGWSQFNAAIDPGNNGVKLRRRINRANNGLQRADVYIDGTKVAESPWYICTPSRSPAGTIQNSWFDSDFEVPAAYTAGKSRITVKVQYVDSKDDLGINEYYYWIYSYKDGITEPAEINLALGKPASASSQLDNNYSADKAVDGDPYKTRWNASISDVNNSWLQIDFGAPTTFNKVKIRECTVWSQIQAFKIQYWNGSKWLDACEGTCIGNNKPLVFEAVTGSMMRLLVTSATRSPSIYEMEVYNGDLPGLRSRAATTAR